MAQRVAVLGVTGRLGRALVRTLGPQNVQGLSRTVGQPGLAAHVCADRRDRAALAEVVAGADAIIDLCGFDGDDGAALASVVGKVPVVFASALAERPCAVWGDEAADSAAPLDPYGQGKLDAVTALREAGGRVLSLRLPQLIAPDDPRPRESGYLQDCDQLGHALLPGTGEQLPALAGTDQVAQLILSLLELPDWPEGIQVAHPRPRPLAALVRALLRGAGRPPAVQPHPDPRWRGPHSGGSERVDTRRLTALVPDLAWPELEDSYFALGQRLGRPT